MTPSAGTGWRPTPALGVRGLPTNSLTAIRRRWVRLTTKIASGVRAPARSRSLVEGAVPRVSLPERATTVTTSMTCRSFSARSFLALALVAFVAGCTHEYQITPRFQRKLAGIPDGPVCARGESLAVSVTNASGQPLDAGTTAAGIHTFNHHFTGDPALVLAEGLKEALQEGRCGTASPGTAELHVVLVRMEAHGQPCGFISCDGVAETAVSVTLQDSKGRVLSQQDVSTSATDGCGMSFCSEEETSEISTHALSEAVGKTVAVISATLAKRPTEPIAARPTPGS